MEELVEAYIATDRLDVALGLIQAGGISLPTTSPYIVIDALLQAGRNDEARFLFEESEPIEKLLGSEVVDLWHRDEELYNWAAYALTFREPRHFLACLDRLREPLRQFGDGNSLDDLKDELKLIAARSEFEAKPDQEVEAVAKRLQVRETVYTTLFLMAAESAYDSGLYDLAKSHFRIVAESAQQFDDDTRRNAARILLSLGELDLAVAFLDRVVAPTLVEESGSSTRWLVPASRRIMTHAACEAQLATNLSVRSYPESQLLNAFQRRLEELGRLIGRGRAGEKKSAESIWQEVSANITLLQLGGIEEAFSWERYELNKAMPTIASAVVLMCGVYGDDVRRFVSGKIDEILEGEPGLLGGSDFRRAYAAAMFAHERSLADVERRLAITGSIERHNTPQEYVQEVAEMAITLAHCGGVERAVQLLGEMHDGALGISRPPKKDAQYIMWRNVFQRACIEEPETRSARVRFFSRLLDGLSNTEGSGSAWRVAPTVLIEAAQGETHLAMAAASRMQEAGLLSWEALVGATLKGVAKKRDELAGLCVVLFGRIALPFSNGYDDEIYPLLLQLVRSDRREAAMLAAIDHIQVDAQGQIREAYLNQVDVIARRAGTPNLARVSELLDAEVDRQVRLSDDPYMGLNSLAELSTALREQKDDKKIYYAVKAFERIAAHSEYQEVREFVTLPELVWCTI
ncbi:MAG: hypothetical protein NT113_09455 [Hyphomicrobiales bacterium]|nr:hypothetical protein [Hyphomicrobiales bacterium]